MQTYVRNSMNFLQFYDNNPFLRTLYVFFMPQKRRLLKSVSKAPHFSIIFHTAKIHFSIELCKYFFTLFHNFLRFYYF